MQLKGFVKKIIDGDTLDILIELPLDVYKLERVRLLGINAPELTTESGITSKNYLSNIVDNKNVFIITNDSKLRDKYGRLLATIMLDNININQLLLDKGMCLKYV